jgi:hypothetical protein
MTDYERNRRRSFYTPLYFPETDESIFKKLYKFFTFNILERIQIRFFYILINIKYLNYNRISKSKKNRPFIKYCAMGLQK